MPSSSSETIDLLDLKLLPAWVKESSEAKRYAHYEGEGEDERPRGGDHRSRDGRQRRGKRSANASLARTVQPASAVDGLRRGERPTSNADRENRARRRLDRKTRDRPRPRGQNRIREDRDQSLQSAPLPITVRFLPHPAAIKNVAAQIKSGSLAYSLFSIARLFLEKPERYDVCLTAKSESPLYQLGEHGTISADRQFLETNAFRLAREDFYKIDITQAEPIKGNFSSVAKCRLSGTLLGPTNHHNYQPRLRTLYEQRFSRRMSFSEYQRQIEMVNDPAVVEKWKEEARNVTTFTTLSEETPSTFSSEAETERHFRQNYMPGLVRTTEESTIDGVTSRRLPDPALRRLIEDAWSNENRSPSNIMQELAKQFRENSGLQIFRHRRGMLFVSPIRVRAFVHDQTSVSTPIKGILETLAANPGINRKELAEKLIGPSLSDDPANEDAESRKLALASDLHWLISAGYVIEFNDGSLDLPRVKAKPAIEAAVSAAEDGSATTVKDEKELVGSTESCPTDQAEVGGS
jgi:hypothetical protein